MRIRLRPLLCALPALALLVFLAPASAEETPPEGPPWHATWVGAKREALRTGRPIFAYFTKHH